MHREVIHLTCATKFSCRDFGVAQPRKRRSDTQPKVALLGGVSANAPVPDRPS